MPLRFSVFATAIMSFKNYSMSSKLLNSFTQNFLLHYLIILLVYVESVLVSIVSFLILITYGFLLSRGFQILLMFLEWLFTWIFSVYSFLVSMTSTLIFIFFQLINFQVISTVHKFYIFLIFKHNYLRL